jgi:transposase-like protein
MDTFSFCPNPECEHHQKALTTNWYVALGTYYTKCFGRIQRYRCKSCHRIFSSQTFSLDYYAKRTIDYETLEELLASSMSQRALSRHFNLSCNSVQNRIDRLARQGLALHARLRKTLPPTEAICIDGFVSFDTSQYFPNNITMAVTKDSQFMHSMTHATLRRSGSMTNAQKDKRAKLDRAFSFEKRALERSFQELLDALAETWKPRPGTKYVLITDEKQEYARALARHFMEAFITHTTVSSKAARTSTNPLFSSNYTDRELRKDQANHRRETLCFSRNVGNMMNRLIVYMVWHNYKKPYRISKKGKNRLTHGEMAGIAKEAIAYERALLFRERAFLHRADIPTLEMRLWMRAFRTPLKKKADYLPKYAVG